MKRLFYSLLAGVTMLASCQKDADLAMDGDGMVDVTITAAMDGASSTTRAITAYGDGATIDRCIMEVYCDNVLYKRMVAVPNALDGDTRTVDFDLRLVASKTYNFLFWADDSKGFANTAENTDRSDGATYDNYYDTDSADGLKAVTANYDSYVGSDESRDAFFGSILGKTIDGSVVLPVTLTRPFGQLNVLTYLTDVPSAMYPETVQVTYSTEVCTTLDVSSGDISGAKAIVWNAAAEVIDGAVDSDNLMHLTTDYILAPTTGQQLVDFSMTFNDADGDLITTSDIFNSIPIQRNYRTNVIGELLTKQGTLSVTIDPIFLKEDIEISMSDVATLAALYVAMDADSSKIDASYTITDEVDGVDSNTASVAIPAFDGTTSTDDTISRAFDFAGGIEANTTLTVTYEDGVTGTNAPEIVYITVPDDNAGTLNIDLPYSTVYVNGKLQDANVATDVATFIIQEGAVVTNLTIAKGNVEVYGTLAGDVQLADDNTTATTITVYTATADVTGVTSWGNNITVIYTDPSAPIQNTTSGSSYTDLQEAVNAAAKGDTIEIAAGTYMLATPESTEVYYCKVTVDDLTIKGTGEVIIYAEAYTGTQGGNGHVQNVITVNGNNLTLDGLTFYAHDNKYYYYGGDTCYPNKTLEQPRAYSGLTINNCTFLGIGGSKTTGAGRLYLGSSSTADLDATTATITNSTFYCGGVSAHSGDVSIDGCTFNGIYYNYEYSGTSYGGDGYYCAWARRGADMTITNSTFTNVEETHMVTDTHGNSMIYAPIMASGDTEATTPYSATTVTATGCTFPSNSGNYGYVTAANELTINGEAYVPAIYNETTGVGYDTIDEAVEAAVSNDVISLAAGVYDITREKSTDLFMNITESLTIKAADGLTADDVAVVSTTVSTTGNTCDQTTIWINYGGDLSSNIEVIFENLTLMTHIYYPDYEKNNSSFVQYADKIVEVCGDATLTMKNCVVKPNTYVDGYEPLAGGFVYGAGDATINMYDCELVNSVLYADNIDTAVWDIKNTIFDNTRIYMNSYNSSFRPQDSRFEMNIDNCEFKNWIGGYSESYGDSDLITSAYGAIIITNTTLPTDDTSLYYTIRDDGYTYVTSDAIIGGLVKINGDIYTPTLYNYTQRQVYGEFSDLTSSSNLTESDVLYVGAGSYELTVAPNYTKYITINGANKGIAGYSAERGDETIISPKTSGSGVIAIAASTDSTECNITFDGVKFSGDSGTNPYIAIEGGDNIVIKNSIIAVTVPTSSDSSTHKERVIYSLASKKDCSLTLENNLFAPIADQQQKIVMNNGTSGFYNTGIFTGNVFNYTHANVAVYQANSTFTITGNTFDGAESRAIMTNGTYSRYTITGNIFQNLDVALQSCGGTLSDEQKTAFNADNTFNNVTTIYDIYQ